MKRNVINKHRNSPFGLTSEFFKSGIPFSGKTLNDLVKGVLVITNGPGFEGLHILNNSGQVITVAQASNTSLPSNVIDKINEVISEISGGIIETIDEQIDDKVYGEYNNLVINSGNTIISTLQTYVDEEIGENEQQIDDINTRLEAEKEYLLGVISGLTEEIENLKEIISTGTSSDHVFISEAAYNALLDGEEIKINENGDRLYPGDAGYDDADFIRYKSNVYYCIPEASITPTGGTDVIISGNVINGDFEIENEHTLILDEFTEISGNTLIFVEGQEPDAGDGTEIQDTGIFIAGNNFSIENETMLVIPNSYRVENNTLII